MGISALFLFDLKKRCWKFGEKNGFRKTTLKKRSQKNDVRKKTVLEKRFWNLERNNFRKTIAQASRGALLE